ncbi:MAG: hypothetical protein HC935_05570 [Pseudanabaena sp. SU_2_4]|nr:hypothetical protein [Pseudanabaena sp. SU_2_4]
MTKDSRPKNSPNDQQPSQPDPWESALNKCRAFARSPFGHFVANALMVLGLVFGLYEFFDWCSGKPSFVGGSTGNAFFIFKNPFLATYMLLPIAWSQTIRDFIRNSLLSQWSMLTHPWMHRWISPFLQAFCFVILANQIREIAQLSKIGRPFTPTNSASIFVSIIGITLRANAHDSLQKRKEEKRISRM